MKKWIAAMIIILLTLSSAVISMAAGETITHESGEKRGSITVGYNAGVTYAVTIPASVTFSDTENVAERSLQVTNVVLNEGSVLHVNLASRNNFKMMNGEGYMEYHLKINSHDVQEDDQYTILSVSAGEPSGWVILNFVTDLQKDHLLYAGNYTDTLTFTVSIE